MAFEMPVAGFSVNDIENPDQLIAHDADSIRSLKVTLSSGQNLKRGAVVGAVSGDSPGGHYILSLTGANDGSQNPRGIVAQDCDATSADTDCLIYVAGTFNAHKVILGTAWTLDSIYEPLRVVGIFLELNPVIAP